MRRGSVAGLLSLGLGLSLGNAACSVNEPDLPASPAGDERWEGGAKPKGPVAAPAPTAPTDPSARATPSPAASGLTGRATLEYRAGKEPTRTIVAMAEGKRVRFDLPTGLPVGTGKGAQPGPTRLLFDTDHRKGVVVRDEQKKATVFSLSHLPEHLGLGAAAGGTPPAALATLERTEAAATVAGRPCRTWTARLAEGRSARVCAAEASAPWLAVEGAALPADLAWLAPLLDGRHVPLRIDTLSKSGELEARLEVKELTVMGLHPSDFRIPKEYVLVDLTKNAAP